MQRHSPDMKVALAGFGILCLLAGLYPAIAEQIGAPNQTVAETPRSATMPFTLDHNRMIVEVEFVRPDGTVRKARAWVDTGSQYLTLSEPLARDLGLDVSGLQSGKTSVELTAPAPAMRLNGLSLHVDGVRTKVQSGAYVLSGDLDIVGLTLRPDANGGITIASIVNQNGKPVVDGILPGDKLIRVDKVEVASATMGEVVDALRGIPGSTRTLTIEREGKRLTINAKVRRLP